MFMETPKFTITDINEVIRGAGAETGVDIPGEKTAWPGLRHAVYVAKRRAMERSGSNWRVSESLHPSYPTQYDGEHTVEVFRELHEMAIGKNFPYGFSELGITPRTITNAEQILFSTPFTNNYQNTNETVHTKEDDGREPYPIRGHHLQNYWGFVKGISPAIYGALYRKEYQRYRSEEGKYTHEGRWYLRDLAGATMQDLERHEANLIGAIHEFNSLPYDYPVEILAG